MWSPKRVVLLGVSFVLILVLFLGYGFSAVVIGKDTRSPEISTVKGRVGLLTFDRPISNLSEISGRKITEAELTGQIQIVNNRKRAEHDQDLRISINLGPLYYHEASRKI